MEDVQVLVIVDKLPLDTYVNEGENKKGLYLSHFYLGFSVTVKSIHMTEKESEMKMQPRIGNVHLPHTHLCWVLGY